MKRARIAATIISIVLALCLAMTLKNGFANEAAILGADLTPKAYLPFIVAEGRLIYASRNLAHHALSAECNPGQGTDCPCSAEDVRIASFDSYGEVTSNARETHTYVNAIGHKKFVETFPDGEAIALGVYRYTGQFSLPVLPSPDLSQRQNPQAVHMMIQLWDGRNALFPANKTTREGVILWYINPWVEDYGEIMVYVKPLELVKTGIRLTPDTDWHTFELVVDLAAQEYVSVTIDGETRNLDGFELARVSQPEWGGEVAFTITTESLAAWPKADCQYIFSWTTRFRDLRLFMH